MAERFAEHVLHRVRFDPAGQHGYVYRSREWRESARDLPSASHLRRPSDTCHRACCPALRRQRQHIPLLYDPPPPSPPALHSDSVRREPFAPVRHEQLPPEISRDQPR